MTYATIQAMNLNDIFKNIEGNPQFSKDILTYVKYLVLQGTDKNNKEELTELLENDSLPQLLTFGEKYTSDFSQKITNYVGDYFI